MAKKLKVLVIRFSAIGDILLTFHVLKAIRNTHPEADIHVLTKAENASIFEGIDVPIVVHSLNQSLYKTARQLQKEHFTHVIDLHNNLRTRFLQFAMLRWEWSRFKKWNIRKWLLTQFKLNTLPQMHVVDRYLEACTKLQLDLSHRGNILKPSSHSVEEFGLQKQSYVAWVLGAKFATKQMPVEKIKEILSLLNVPVVFLGGNSEHAMAMELLHAFPQATNLVGKTSLWQSADVLRDAKVTVSNDTGLMHLASFYPAPIVTIWGNTTRDFGMYPYQKSNVFYAEVPDLSCRPCSKIGHQACPKGHFDCMLRQDAVKIATQITALYHQEIAEFPE